MPSGGLWRHAPPPPFLVSSSSLVICPLTHPILPQARVEIGIVQMLNTRCDPDDRHHIVRMLDCFVHQRHLCLVFELLNINLYELIRQNHFRGLSMHLQRLFLVQVPCPALPHTRAPHVYNTGLHALSTCGGIRRSPGARTSALSAHCRPGSTHSKIDFF